MQTTNGQKTERKYAHSGCIIPGRAGANGGAILLVSGVDVERTILGGLRYVKT